MLRNLTNGTGRLLRRLAVHRTQTPCRHNSSSYDCDGKTTAKILNNDRSLGLMINTISQVGFKLNNSCEIVGPMVIFPRTVLQWNVNTLADIHEQSLSLLLAVEPKLEIVIVGIGDGVVSPELTDRIHAIFKGTGVAVEVLNTRHACTTFNFLNCESRLVAAALLPPKEVQRGENKTYVEAEKRRKAIYGDDETVMKIPPSF